jgi:hypothetical protein
MHLNALGPVAALSAFLGIWLGHVSVRRIEFVSPSLWPPALLFISLGLALEFASAWASSLPLAAACGILGVTLLWDSLELVRQQRRVRKGHAPANSRNPRHARILAQFPAATARDVLKREPLGRPVSPSEAVSLLSERS